MRKIVINNQKGGSGKTTTAVNVSAGLAEKGRKVLLVDLDQQASSSIWLGFSKTNVEEDLFDVTQGPELIRVLAQKTKVKNLEIIPFLPLKGKNSKEFRDYKGKATILKSKFSHLSNDIWDYVIFDCSPGLNISTLNALVTADELLIPVTTHALALYGVISLLETMESVQLKLNPDLYITGIVACRVDPNIKHNMEILELLIEKFGVLVYNTYIKEDIKLAECPSFAQTIFQYDPKSIGATDYRALANEIIAQEKKNNRG